ncbi:uncharacterized protein KIAA1143 homolog [Drosophila kikkawai]|uniref:Uncharacterized protein KIAA1143 homolog n=1 Tax=Drosophila kikkawai TaxID=30033 RepID=A0A6P4IJL2_DROKI|nr:uncharacterized protein KIAA1143 homolog [Drosophila kikkawai]
MSKRGNNITYVKPQEPSFLAKLKAEIGYKEGPTVDTKRQRLETDPDREDYDSGEDEKRPEREDEQPQVVVLKPGDLSAEEAQLEKQLAAKELAEKRADLNQPIVFKQRVKQPNVEADKSESGTSKKSGNKPENTGKKSKSKKSKSAATTSKLSFNEDEEDEAGED